MSKIKTREFSIKQKDTRGIAERAFRHASIKDMTRRAKPVQTNRQTAEGDAVDTSTEAVSATMQKVKPHIRQQKRRRQQSKTNNRSGTTTTENPVSPDPKMPPTTDVVPPSTEGRMRQHDLQRIKRNGRKRTSTHFSVVRESPKDFADGSQPHTSLKPLQSIGNRPKGTTPIHTDVKNVATDTVKDIPVETVMPQEKAANTVHDAASSTVRIKHAATERATAVEVNTSAAIRPKEAKRTIKRNLHVKTKATTIRPNRAKRATISNARKKAAAQRVLQAGKAVIRGVVKTLRSAVSALIGGAAGALAPLMVVVLIGGLLCSPFAIFFSGEIDGEMTLQEAVSQLNMEFSDRLSEIENAVAHDDLRQNGSRAMWKEILAVYAVRVTADTENPMDAATMDADHFAVLKTVFWDMNAIDYTTEIYTEEETVLIPNEASDAEEGELIEETQTTERTRLIITITSKSAQQMAEEYGFDAEQCSLLQELLSEDYAELWSGIPITGGSDDIVQVALSQVGNVGGQPYWSWYGFSSRVAWCACFVSWCADQCGYIEAGTFPKFSYCDTGVEWFKSRGQWLPSGSVPAPGCIIFFDWNRNGITDHVGIVESCDGSYVYTIEGNANDAVKRLSYSINHGGIAGYGVLVF